MSKDEIGALVCVLGVAAECARKYGWTRARFLKLADLAFDREENGGRWIFEREGARGMSERDWADIEAETMIDDGEGNYGNSQTRVAGSLDSDAARIAVASALRAAHANGAASERARVRARLEGAWVEALANFIWPIVYRNEIMGGRPNVPQWGRSVEVAEFIRASYLAALDEPGAGAGEAGKEST